MISGFLDRISGLFDKGLILGALFPLLIVGFILAAYAATILGWRASLSWLEDLSASGTVALSMLLTIVLFLVAFMLRSLRTPILAVWSGGVGAPQWLIERQSNRRNKMEQRINSPRIWEGAKEKKFQSEPRNHLIPTDRRDELLSRVNHLYTLDTKPEQGKLLYESICKNLSAAYQQYDYKRLMNVFQRLREFVIPRDNEETVRRYDLRARLVLEFGPPGIIKATRLGNILVALDSYPYDRYRMEGGTFWPHLEQRMQGDLLDEVRNQRILLDFLLALASLLAFVAVLAGVSGPWVSLGLTWVFGFIAGVFSFATYQLSLPVAVALSRALRAGCDLFRRDLLSALGRDPPDTLEEEQAAWQKLSQLVIYGEPIDLSFRSPPPREAASC
jgi:hypothetical protein